MPLAESCSGQLYRLLMENVSPDPLFVHDHDGRFLDVNAKACEALGYSREELLAINVVDVERDSDLPAAQAAWSTIKPGSAMILLGRQRRKDGSTFPVEVHLGMLEAGDRRVYVGAARDITDITAARRLTDELKITRLDLQAMIDHVPAGISAWNADYTNVFMNRAAETEFGTSAIAAVGKTGWDILGPERFNQLKPQIDAALAGQPQSYEQAELQSDGTIQYRQISLVPQRREGEVVGFYALATDITDLRDSHQRIRELAQRLESAREAERRTAALALHEGIAQELFAIKLGLDHLKPRVRGNSGDTRECEELVAMLDRCIKDTRQIANTLRPAVLAHLCLRDALIEHARHVAGPTGLRIHVSAPEPLPVVDETTALLLYRTAQEALTNVAQHARASQVTIALQADSGYVRMEVTDDGIGIEKAALNKVGALGLLGIRERFAALGGLFSIERNPGAGTTLLVQLPH